MPTNATLADIAAALRPAVDVPLEVVERERLHVEPLREAHDQVGEVRAEGL